MPFAQHRDIFYLWGRSRRKHSSLSRCSIRHQREILFLKETNEHIAVWEGEKLTKDRALAVSGIKQSIGCRFEKFCLFDTLKPFISILMSTTVPL
jgi:Xaa-Pro aminopeptidase